MKMGLIGGNDDQSWQSRGSLVCIARRDELAEPTKVAGWTGLGRRIPVNFALCPRAKSAISHLGKGDSACAGP